MDTSEQETEPPSKRRKTRKGTHSCWECKKRKERCIFIKEDVTCVSCQKRGTACIGQELPDNSHLQISGSRPTGDLRRVESLLQQLLDRVVGQRSEAHGKAHEDSSDDRLHKAEAIRALETPPITSDSDHNGHEVLSNSIANALPLERSGPEHQGYPRSQSQDLSQMLYAALPSQSDAEIICRVTKRYHMGDVMVCGYDAEDSDGHDMAIELLNYPERTAPPVLIARHLLRFATHMLHWFRPRLHEEIQELSASLPVLIASYANAATQFLSQDRLQYSLESLECIVLQAMYECSCGNMRMSWMMVRRAIAVAQMNGLHLHEGRRYYLPSNSKPRLTPRTMWIRLNYWDRMSSLMLALPMAVEDSSITVNPVADEPCLAKLERMHCAILGGIIKRNQAEMACPSFETTKALDKELQEIATILPNSWWMMPLLALESSSAQSFRRGMDRLTLQMAHYHIILQVHLPYLLQSYSGSNYALSRMACVDAAREVLTRFIMCSSLNYNNMACRVVDFIAFMAAVTLALAYMSRHHQCSTTSTWPAHHRYSDLGMIQRVEEIMQENHPVPQCTYMANVLRQLLRMETKAADGRKVVIKHIKFTEFPAETNQIQDEVNLQVPYFGTIVISPDPSPVQEDSQPRESITYGSRGGLEALADPALLSSSEPEGGSYPLNFSNAEAPSQEFPAMASSAEQFSYDAMPGMFAGADDWLLQGIDTTLFSSLFGQSGGDWVLNA